MGYGYKKGKKKCELHQVFSGETGNPDATAQGNGDVSPGKMWITMGTDVLKIKREQVGQIVEIVGN